MQLNNRWGMFVPPGTVENSPVEDDKTKEVIHTFRTKENATKGGALKKQLGAKGGSVKIKKEDGTFQEGRTFPRSKDPKISPG